MCVLKKGRRLTPFQLQVNEMNEKMSFKMGMEFAVSFYMGIKEFFLDISYKVSIEAKVPRLSYK